MRLNKLTKLLIKPIAHRGLHGGDIIENTLPAYQKALDKGYPIEIDLYSTTDGEIVVFHDDNLKRMTGVDKYIYDCTLTELKKLKLKNGDMTIPTLKEVLALIDGKVPLLIELKDQPNKDYLNSVVEILKNYNGDFAIQSFNPFYLMKIKKLAPDFLRGTLGTDEKVKNQGFLTRFVIKHMPFNFIIQPDFISYRKDYILKGKVKRKKRPLLAWTITNQSEIENLKDKVDNVIFENFLPKE